MSTRTCLTCGGELPRYRGKYCSDECCNKAHIKTCPECGNDRYLTASGICQACVKRHGRQSRASQYAKGGQERENQLRRDVNARLTAGVERVVARAEKEGTLYHVALKIPRAPITELAGVKVG